MLSSVIRARKTQSTLHTSSFIAVVQTRQITFHKVCDDVRLLFYFFLDFFGGAGGASFDGAAADDLFDFNVAFFDFLPSFLSDEEECLR